MEVKLIVAHGKHAGMQVPVAGPKFFIGRAEDCQLRPRSDLVSRHHCVILVEEGFLAVRDFGSKNGTLVNGEKVHGEQELKNGDRLTVGELEFEVHVAVPVGGKKKPKVHSVQEAAARTVQSTADDDLDIASLLGEDVAGPGAAAASDTQKLGATRSDSVHAAEPDQAKAAAPDAEAPDEKEAGGEEAAEDEAKKEETEGKPAKVPGMWSRGKKPDTASSRQAAADMLKNFFKRF